MTELERKMKSNASFRRKVEWYMLGQRRCHCCGVQLNWVHGHKNSATVEHMVPASEGGTLHKANTLIICYTCNHNRRTKNWIKHVEHMPKSEWLIQKYLAAVAMYVKHSHKLSPGIHNGVREYKRKIQS